METSILFLGVKVANLTLLKENVKRFLLKVIGQDFIIGLFLSLTAFKFWEAFAIASQVKSAGSHFLTS